MSELQPIPWDDSIKTGVAEVDVQHKFLIDLINELAESINLGQAASRVGKTLNLLKYYAEWHFGREEICMERHQCPVAAINKKAHSYFLDTFASFQEQYRESGGSVELAVQMYQELTQWLVSHIQGVDTKLGPCIHTTH